MRISDWSTDVCSSDLLLGNNFLYRRPRFAGDQLHLSLRREFWIRHLDRQYASQALAHVVTGDIDFRALGVIVLLDELVDDTRHHRAQSGQMCAAIGLRAIVGEAQDLFGVAIVDRKSTRLNS